MKIDQKVLCPVDLSDQGPEAIELATQIAKQNDTTISFLYVSPYWDSEAALSGSPYLKQLEDEDKQALEKIRPTDASVAYEHLFLKGNPGPEIVKASKSAGLVLMSTHGRSAVMRLIMGGVAQYVLRNSKCPVVLVKGPPVFEEADASKKTETSSEDQKHFVTEVMHQVAPVHAYEKMDDVLAQLEKANETAAPVVDGPGECIGILTSSDIEHYHELLERFSAHDETVIEEMFEVNKYGQRRASNEDFDQVKRHMSKELVSIRNDQSIADVIQLFEANPNIHHLVVVDEDNHGVGIVDSSNVIKMTESSTPS